MKSKLTILLFAVAVGNPSSFAEMITGSEAVEKLHPLAQKINSVLWPDLSGVKGETPSHKECTLSASLSANAQGKISVISFTARSGSKLAKFLVSSAPAESKIPATNVDYQLIRCPGCFKATSEYEVKNSLPAAGPQIASITYTPNAEDLSVVITQASAEKPNSITKIACTFKGVARKLR